MKKLIPTFETVSVDTYPYGRLQCTATFAIEFNRKHGFRSLFQTIDPKTNRVNNPKKGTYNPIMYLSQDENGFVSFHSMSFYKMEDYNKVYEFLGNNMHLFTSEQKEFLYNYAIVALVSTLKAYVVYNGAKIEHVKPFITPLVDKIKEGLREKKNVWNELCLDVEGLEKTKVEGYNPFVIKESSMVLLG